MQQINLYLPEFHPRFDPLEAKNLLIALAIFLASLICFQWSLVIERTGLKHAALAGQAEIEALEATLDRQKKIPKAMDKAKIEEAISQAETAIHNREYAQNIIHSKNLGNDKGFSAALTALANLSLQELTLTEFALTQGGRQVELAGMATKGAAVPEYLHRLQKDSSFKNSNFGVLQMQKSSRPNQIEFHCGKLDRDKNNPEKDSTKISPIMNP